VELSRPPVLGVPRLDGPLAQPIAVSG